MLPSTFLFESLVFLSNEGRRFGNVLAQDVSLDEVREPYGELMFDVFARRDVENI